ncbi:MAG: hypothetical protein B6D72_09940 [gamma proteobacterium symbiont of Ctena orbiculata]|uniref:Uncharacterized protein n=1 Tax=Candidatus Thiodiazotropha taylori TaxID=2792791 RepID=A0A944MBQ6_9GAMM|nr:hypothetical protein [Candidatus Thiodiazotropha taylori]PUB84462.1 MAG: hypothetical protein DBP00_14775 [gamma proteobacterium symbiont of Ctena orbiculata]MBT2988482.1 hypothetical protein [Candidatus Thiodiazotropha taylori]MBT2997388.1 hypothetical protein [Candidatus Thiodiazotropha taylori]MBT3000902.1 hypothetical protein [Candidatus Thiodiazotropha taylori]
MDQDAFRRTYREMNERICAYEKSILSRHCGCSQSKKLCIAEREGVHCVSDEALQQCLELLDKLRHQARFALKSNDDRSVLPHGKAMRLQVGGLRGLFSAIYPDQPIPELIDDVFDLINRATTAYGKLENLPFQTLIQQVSAYKGRQRGINR